MKRVVLNLMLIFCTFYVAFSQEISEPEFLYDGYFIANNGEIIPASAYKAYTETYIDWSKDKARAVRIKVKGKTSATRLKADTPFKYAIRTGYNNNAPSTFFSVLTMKQKKKDRRINFIGYYVAGRATATTNTNNNVNANKTSNSVGIQSQGNQTTEITYNSGPGYCDRFPESDVRIQGKKLGEQSYLLSIPPLEIGEYAITFRLENGDIMIVDFSVE